MYTTKRFDLNMTIHYMEGMQKIDTIQKKKISKTVAFEIIKKVMETDPTMVLMTFKEHK